DLIRCLRVARHIQRGPRGAQGVLASLVGAEHTVELPAAEHCFRHPGGRPFLAVAEGDFVRVAKLERVRYVVRGRGAVAVEYARRIPAKRGPVAVVGEINGMRVGVSALEEYSAREAPIDRGLERVVGAVCLSVKLPCRGGAPKFGEERPAAIAATGDLRGVDIEEGEAVDGCGPDISHGSNQFGRQLVLND